MSLYRTFPYNVNADLFTHVDLYSLSEGWQRNNSTEKQLKNGGVKRRKKSGPVPAAQACVPTETWLAEGGGRAEGSLTSAPGTTALNLAWAGEACCSQSGTAEEQRASAEETKKKRD